MENEKNSGVHLATRLGSAAINIARGAAQGGVTGAVLEGAKSFAPQLIKFLAGVLFFFLSLPLLIFVALPSSMFGMPDVKNEDVRQMTREAETAEDNYSQTQSRIQEHANSLLQAVSVGYDDVQVNKDLTGLDSYWMAAISSVLHMQDLTEINRMEVDNIVNQAIRYSSRTELYTEEEEYIYITEDGTEEVRTRQVECRRLHIDLHTATPEEIMERLGFTSFECEWARQIHDTIADNQEQADLPAFDVGDVTFTDAERPVVYYSQVDSRWKDTAYSDSTIGIAGCGPASVAIVVSTLSDRAVTPNQVAEWSERTGHACYGNGSYHSLIPDAAIHYGLHVQSVGMPSAQQLIDALSRGKLVVVIMGRGTFTSTGHFMVLRGVTSSGRVLIADPISYNRSQQEWELSLIMQQAKRTAAAGGPFWIIS